MSLDKDLARIEHALKFAAGAIRKFTPGCIDAAYKSGTDPVTAADLEIDNLLREFLVDKDTGWLSEETADDLSRLAMKRVWVVDPLDGTREFVEGIKQWCISVALVEDNQPVAAGIYNPATDELFLGSMQTGVTLNGRSVKVSDETDINKARILASRTEVRRGQWEPFLDKPFQIIPMGSVAYKLARVSAGLAESTFTLVPKNEWDIAAGTLLVCAAGGRVISIDNKVLTFNNPKTLVPGLIAASAVLFDSISSMVRSYLAV